MQFTEHPDAARRCQSAVTAAKAILELDLYEAHKRELLKVGYKSPAQFERERDAKVIKAANDARIATLSNNSQSARLKKRAA